MPKIVNKKLVYKNKRVSIYSKDLKINSKLQKKFYSFSTYNYVWILVKTNTSKIAVVKQYRHAADKYTFEFPSGIIDKNILPKKIAKSEVFEETGLIVKKIKKFGTAEVDIGRNENKAYMYYAECDENKIYKPEKGIKLILLTKKQIIKLIERNKLIHAHTGMFFRAILLKLI